MYEQLKNQDVKLKSKRDLLKVMKSNQPGAMEMEKHVNNSLVLNMERKLDLLAKLGWFPFKNISKKNMTSSKSDQNPEITQ